MSRDMSHRSRLFGWLPHPNFRIGTFSGYAGAFHSGERQTDIAHEFGVDRRTIRRRLDELERADDERAGDLAAKRVRRQAAREKLKLLERGRDSAPCGSDRANSANRASRSGETRMV
jgi:DNA-binding MarR family transcriptional regulator